MEMKKLPIENINCQPFLPWNETGFGRGFTKTAERFINIQENDPTTSKLVNL